MKAKTKRRGGTIDLRGTKPRGLPLRKPRYGPGPYQYRNDRCLFEIYESDEDPIREGLPREFEPRKPI